MKKIQILFPDPEMQRLREAARREDRPISEIVRRQNLDSSGAIPGRARLPALRIRTEVFPYGVDTFYTRNTRDFAEFGWFSVVNPIA